MQYKQPRNNNNNISNNIIIVMINDKNKKWHVEVWQKRNTVN